MLHSVNNREILENFEKLAKTIGDDYIAEVKRLLKQRAEIIQSFSQNKDLEQSKKKNTGI